MIKFLRQNSTTIILILILGLALILRLNGIHIDIPRDGGGSNEVDPSNNALRLFEYKVLFPNFPVYTHGLVLIYINALLYALTFSLSFLFGIFKDLVELRSYLMLNRDILILISRIFSAAAGAASVYLVYVSAKKLFNKKVGLLAALFLAVEFFHIIVSRKAIVWGPMMFFVLAAFCYAIDILRNGRLKSYILAAVFSGLAFGVHLVGGIAIIPPLAAHFFTQKKIISKKTFWNKNLFWLVGVFLGLMALFMALNPSAWLYYTEGEMYSTLSGDFARGHGFNFWRPFYYPFKFIFEFVPFYSLFAVLSIFFLWFKGRQKELALLLALPAFYYIYTGPVSALYQARYFSPFMPFVAILAAYGICSLSQRHYYQKIVLPILILISIAPSLYFSYLLTAIIRQENTVSKAVRWIYQNIPENSRILIQTQGGQFKINENKEFIRFVRDNFDPYFLTGKRKYLLELAENQLPRPAYFPLDLEIIRDKSIEQRILKEYKFDYFLALYYTEEFFTPEHSVLSFIKKGRIAVVFSPENPTMPPIKGVFKIIERPLDEIKRAYLGAKIEIYKLNYKK